MPKDGKRSKKLPPLQHQYEDASEEVNKPKRIKQRNRLANEDPESQEYLDSRTSKAILKQAQQQQEQERMRTALGEDPDKYDAAEDDVSAPAAASDDEEFVEDDDDDTVDDPDKLDSQFEIDPSDEQVLKTFMPAGAPQRRTLADLILAKINENKTVSMAGDVRPPLDPKVIQVFEGVGQILSKYRSGKLPKAFKIIPSLKNWEEVMYVTNPDEWSAAAMFAGTRLFASNLKERMAQRFYNLVLLPRVRDDIAEFRRLNFHLYMAVKKAIYKPAAFFKGFLLPLCEAGDCTLREAVIISGILTKKSIPILHSSAAILKIAEMQYSGANSIFMRVLLDKKYSLPYRVIDAVVGHFYRFTSDTRELPVLWHQCMLVFAQRYKEDITEEQKQALFEVMRVHTHLQITPEVRRELLQSRSRDNEKPMEGQA